MPKDAPQIELEQIYRKRRKALQNKVYSLRKKGVKVDSDIIPEFPKRITDYSVAKINAVSEYVKAIESKAKESEFIKPRRKKTTKSQKQKMAEKDIKSGNARPSKGKPYSPPSAKPFYQNYPLDVHREDDNITATLSSTFNPTSDNTIEKGIAVYQGVQSIMSKYIMITPGKTKNWKIEAADKLTSLFQSKISFYGFDKFMEILASYPEEVLKDVEIVMYYSSFGPGAAAYMELARLLNIDALNVEQLQQYSEYAENFINENGNEELPTVDDDLPDEWEDDIS